MMKLLLVLLALTATATSAPSTVPGDGGTVVSGTSGTGGGLLGFLSVSGGGGSGYVSKTIDTHILQPPQVLSEKVIDVEAPPQPPPAPAKKTVIERTVIPQYVEKRVQVPTYVERTIRVPTYVERTVKVQVAPTVVEKEISHEEVPIPKDEVRVITTARPYGGIAFHKVISAGNGPARYSYTTGGGGGAALYNNIFSIPIQTLAAVNSFLNGLARGLTGGVSFSAGKTYSAY